MKRLVAAIALLAALLVMTPVSASSSPTIVKFFTSSTVYTGGQKHTVQINLNVAPTSDMTVSLATDRPDVLSVPSSVTIGAGVRNKQFSVQSSVVSSTVTVAITATPPSGGSETLSFQIAPAKLSSVMTPGKMTGGTNSTGTVKITGAAPAGGLTVSLSSDNPLVTVQSSVTVPAGQKSAKYSISTGTTANSVNVTITAADNSGTAKAKLTVNPAVLTSIKVSPSAVKGGNDGDATVTLSGPAASDTVVTISTTSDLLSVPESVVIPAGSTKASFSFETTDVDAMAKVSISVSSNGVTKTAKFSLRA